MRVWGVPVKVHPLTLAMAAAAVWLGERERLAVTAASLLMHELGHLLAARAAGVEVTELEILPLGGAIRLRGAWEMRPAQLLTAALAGPAVNLLLACAATLARKPQWVNANLALLLFNLIPALPLDGGRALAGLLSAKMRLSQAARVGVWAGWAVSAGLILAFARGLSLGRINLTLLAAAAYMARCGKRELLLADNASLLSLLSRRGELEREGALPVRLLAVPKSASAQEVALRLSPRRLHVICPCDEDMTILGTVSEKRLLRQAMDAGDTPVGTLAAGNPPASIVRDASKTGRG